MFIYIKYSYMIFIQQNNLEKIFTISIFGEKKQNKKTLPVKE